MNLWAKRTGQLLVAVLFLMSCEDDSFLLGFKNKNKQFDVRYLEFTFADDETSVMLIDSIQTNNFGYGASSTARFLLGEYDDPYFGTVKSEVYTQFIPAVASQITDAVLADFDSVTIQLKLDFYYYGHNADSEEKFTIFPLEDTLSLYQRYYYNSSVPYTPTPLGEAKINVRYFALREVGNSDTLRIKGRLDDDYGRSIFQYMLSNDSLGNKDFRNAFKGLAIVPSQNNYILGVDPGGTVSKLTIHYHKGTTALERYFFFRPQVTGVGNNFSKISTDRIGDLAAISQPYEGYVPAGGILAIQNGSPAVTTLDLSKYYDFIRGNGPDGEDSLKKILINSSEFSIGIQTPPVDLPPPSKLILRVLRKTPPSHYLFMNRVLDADSAAMIGFALEPDGKYYVASGDVSAFMELTYNKSTKRYVGRPTVFLQNLFDQKEVDVDVAHFAIYPYTPEVGKSVNRVLFNKNDIKLGIYYTKVNLSNLE